MTRPRLALIPALAAIAAAGCSTIPNGHASGVWVGDLKLCRDTVTGAVPGTSPYDLSPVLTLRLNEAAARRFGIMTGALVGRPLAVRVNGRVVMEPTVTEPILGGEVQITGPDEAAMREIARAVKQPC
ncbi:MAG: SecDF P1 head subdomain-containing protein [Novosphingobium sp.]